MGRKKKISVKLPRWSIVVLGFFVFLALSGRFIANDGQSLVSPLVPYSPSYMDSANANYVSPFEEQKVSGIYKRHWLGTDGLGRDVLSGIINGAWIAFWVSLLSVSIALMLGIPFGMIAGFYGDSYKIGVIEFILGLVSKLLLFYLLFYFVSEWSILITSFLLIVMINIVLKLALNRFYPNRKKWNLSVDSWMTRFLEIFKSIPTLIILILLLGMISNPGIMTIAICLGFLLWVRIARYIRAEVLAIKETGFILAQKSVGTSDFRIMINHCLPKAIPPVMVSIIFLAASTILMEATLSFLGLGLSIEKVSWGSMLNESRNYLGAWWMAVFPGLSLFLVIAALANESDYWSKKMQRNN